jgi:hypothetical protein
MPMVDISAVFAAMIEGHQDGRPLMYRDFVKTWARSSAVEAKIYSLNKTEVFTHVYILTRMAS